MLVNYALPLHKFCRGKNMKELLMKEYEQTQKRLLFYEGLIEHRIFMFAVSMVVGLIAFILRKEPISALFTIENVTASWLTLGLILIAISYGIFVYVGKILVNKILNRQEEIVLHIQKLEEEKR